MLGPGSYRQAARIISAHSRHTLPPIGVFGGTRRARAHARTRNSRANLLHQQAEDTTIWAPIAGGNSPTVKTEDADLQELLGRLNKSIRSDNRIEYESGIEYPQLAFEHLEDVEPANQASQVPPAIASGNEPGLQLLPFTVEEAALFSTENLARIYEKIVATETGSNNSNGADDTVQDEPESSQAAATIAGPSSHTVAGGDNPIIRQRNAPKAFRYSAAVLKDKSCAPLAIKRRALPFGLFRPPPFTTSVGTEAVEYYMKREHGGRPRKNAASASADALATRLLNMQNKRASRDREAAIKTLCEARDNVRSFLERGGPRKFHQWIYSQLGHRHRRPAPRNSIGCHVEQRNLHAMYAAGIATGQYSTHRNGSQIPFSRAIDTNGELHAAGYLNPAEGSYKSPYLSLETPAPAQHNVNDDGTTSQLQPSETDRQDKGKGRATAATEQSYSQNYIPPPPGWEEEEVGEGEGEREENEEGEDPAAQMFSDADMDAEGETDHEWEG